MKNQEIIPPFPWRNPRNAYMWGFIHGMCFISACYFLLLYFLL